MRTRRRRHSSQFKRQVLVEASQPGTSVAAVARRHGLNANLTHRWRTAALDREGISPRPGFLALPAPPRPPTDTCADDVIRI
ncbi:MAG: transposase [Pseudomonadota bacterium]